ncbi:MAG: hypothetical protein QOE72_704 [Chloroflexota bacterium]|nr:hypothetical protein [Chloroflexota bacterium]
MDPPSGFTGGALEPRMGIMRDPAAPSRPPSPRIVRFSKSNAGVARVVPRRVAAPNSDREASAAGECRRGGAGAGIGRASARCLATERGGRSPPRVKTGGRAAPRESRPAAELPGISTGRRTAAPLHPVADRPSNSTRPQNARASPPAADRPSIPTGRRTPEHPHRSRCGRSASRWSPATAVGPVSDSGEPGAGPRSRRAKSPPPETSFRCPPGSHVIAYERPVRILAGGSARDGAQEWLSDTRRSCRSRPRSGAGRVPGRSPRPRRAAPPG